MRRISRSVLGFTSALLGGLAVFAAVQFSSVGREANPVPQFNVQDKPIERQTHGVTSYAPVIKRAAPSVVTIYSTRTVRMTRMPINRFGDPFRDFFGDGSEDEDTPRRGRNGDTLTRKEQGLGSGVIVSSEGYILTANHVVQDADPNGVKVSLPAGGKEMVARIVGADPATDVAVLKIDAKDLPAIVIADSDKLEVGDVCLAIGNPFGVGQTVTMGMVSGLGRTSLDINQYENFIQTDAAINQGNSGGALIDADGRLIGINTAIFSPSGANAGIGFAVPANLARSVMERLIKYGKITRGFLGVRLQPEITPDVAREFQLPDREGAMVTDVDPNTPAAAAGLQSGDVIRELNGKKIADRPQLRLAISDLAPGTKVTLKVLRSEPGKAPQEKTITATLGSMPELRATGRNRATPNDEVTPSSDALDGVEVSDLDPATRRQFRIPNNVQGALVTNVDPNSSSADAGLRVGDVVLEIDRKPVHNADEAVQLSDKVKNHHTTLRVWRQGGSVYLGVDEKK